MAETIQFHDFITLHYIGKLPDGTVFDTTEEAVAKQHQLYNQNASYGPMTICIGEKQILPGLDDALLGKEIGKKCTVALSPEQAFGKRDIKNLRIVPMSVFREHKMNPRPGLQITVDGQLGIVNSVSGGRVIVNFNHPLAGREVQYAVEIIEKVTDAKKQLEAFLHTAFHIPTKDMRVELQGKKAIVTVPMALPNEFSEMLGKKLATLTGLEEVTIAGKTMPKEVARQEAGPAPEA
ncbi:MAG TPA: peptidylprolyl isomerase [Candidatus Nanoarchaeia archaeon]|nr:peptidylprolyl isomerase [Candidatus Nanoarchaeia archaeon]